VSSQGGKRVRASRFSDLKCALVAHMATTGRPRNPLSPQCPSKASALDATPTVLMVSPNPTTR